METTNQNTVTNADLDNTLNAAMQFLSYAHRPSVDFTGSVHFCITDNSSVVHKCVKVSPSGIEIFDGQVLPDGSPLTCNVALSKDVLLAVLGGALDPMIAFMCGQIVIDNPMSLIAFIKSFELSPQKFLEFRNQLESSQPASESSVTTPAVESNVVPSTMPSASGVKVTLALTGLKLINAVRVLATEIDKSSTLVRANPKYQTLVTKLEETSNGLQQTQTYQTLQANPTFVYLKDYVTKEIAAQKIPETFSNYTTKAGELTSVLVSYLLETAYNNNANNVTQTSTVDSEQERLNKKKQLEQQLEELRAKNKKNEEERQSRIAKSVGQEKPNSQ